ncbi:hypothetical protein [Siccirubricoccus deserti]|uniref:Uncharacterized protein n=1 Tax=Siccirubricoccus deserti TaxID=2013562 RepID=A0A9X0QW66_9PROT|nr:hypothetical protein [Siccirubricoccus deserti]MBC4014625.1 hypothetical protein [Siccirubricoccus deserti]
MEEEEALTRRRGRGEKQRSKLKDAVAAILADLLLNHPRLTRISTNSVNFSGQAVSFDAFGSAAKAMLQLGFIGISKGFQGPDRFWTQGDPVSFRGRWATRFWLTPKLITMAEAFGVLPDASAHFVRPPRNITRGHLVVLHERGEGFGRAKTKGRPMALPQGRHLERLRDEVEEVNGHIAAGDVQGCEPVVLIRDFTLSLGNDNAPALHGRWYAPQVGSYMQIRSNRRPARTVSLG